MVKVFFTNFTKAKIGEKTVKVNVKKICGILNVEGNNQIGVNIISDKRIRELNKQYREKDKVTDILSFSENDVKYKYSEFFRDDLYMKDLGEIFICWKKVEKQAAERGWNNLREFTFLLIHGILHLLGYDHEKEEEAKRMESLEQEIFSQLF